MKPQLFQRLNVVVRQPQSASIFAQPHTKPKGSKRWSASDIQYLKHAINNNFDIDHVVQHFHYSRTLNAVKTQAYLLGATVNNNKFYRKVLL